MNQRAEVKCRRKKEIKKDRKKEKILSKNQRKKEKI